MATFLKPALAYGESQPLIPVMPMVVEAVTAPTASTRGVLGQVIVVSNAVYMLTSVVAGQSVWTSLAGGAGFFTSLVVSSTILAGGGITATTGNITATTGNVTAGGFVGATGNVTSSAIVSGALGVVSGENVYSFGDDGTGTALSTSFTNVVDTTQGVGALSLLSTTGNPGNNTGFLKFYVGTTVVWVPYFADIAP